MKLALILAVALLTGCTTLNSTFTLTCGESNKIAVKTDSDQTPTTTTSAAVPVAVGATPASSGTVNSGGK